MKSSEAFLRTYRMFSRPASVHQTFIMGMKTSWIWRRKKITQREITFSPYYSIIAFFNNRLVLLCIIRLSAALIFFFFLQNVGKIVLTCLLIHLIHLYPKRKRTQTSLRMSACARQQTPVPCRNKLWWGSQAIKVRTVWSVLLNPSVDAIRSPYVFLVC